MIRIRGARQNNLANLDLDLAERRLHVVTGVSGSGKSSLVFDTLYAEGQRRYIETFSPYARQFLARMDAPEVDLIEGVPPAVAIEQRASIRSSRSTVGTMTELADHFRLLHARAATLFCHGCGEPVMRDHVDSVVAWLRSGASGLARVALCFDVPVPSSLAPELVIDGLRAQGYERIRVLDDGTVRVVQDRFRLSTVDGARLSESVETAFVRGHGRMLVTDPDESLAPRRFSTTLHCATCDIGYAEPQPALFSFNSPLGACPTCRGFGRIIGIDPARVIPDPTLSLGDGAIRPWQTDSYRECQDDLCRMARLQGVPLDVAWGALDPAWQRWVFEGDPAWRDWSRSWPGTWYGVRNFFTWLESKSYKMHIRVLLSRYRSYETCPDCGGERLRPAARDWQLVCGDGHRMTLPALFELPVHRLSTLIDTLVIDRNDAAAARVLTEIRTRLEYLQAVGLGYLTLSRASRTLSGGEVQRINLTTALGTALVNTLFVLDEPSIGLHARDLERIIRLLHRLRDAGNTVVVVEHDPQLMLAADDIIDLGPGAGEQGGQVVARGHPAALMGEAASLTGQWLAGARSLMRQTLPTVDPATAPAIVLSGATLHNLRGLDVRIPLGALVCLVGVSGSGKSTLVEHVLYPALQRHFGDAAAPEGTLAALSVPDMLSGVVLIDQTPIGKSARANPASHVDAWGPIRKLFAELPESQARGYTAATFSFNTGKGRCPHCNGSGFEQVEMQFLADVWLRCPVCDGTRYQAAVREVRWRDRSVTDVLALTVDEALTVFADQPAVCRALAPLVSVGLGYLRLGQPVPTLSGGEAQRLKLAGELARPAPRGRKASRLFIFDEPTTGLHPSDIACLLRAFEVLLAAGHSLLIVEHDLSLMAVSDWLIELGPEGGDAGGRLVAATTPAVLATLPDSPTGQALAAHARALADARTQARTPTAAEPAAMRLPQISVHHAREHNLKNLSLSLPREQLSVITGLSGSGKSTLAFDILFAEGQRRYLTSLSAYARQFVQPASRPEVDAVSGLAPTVAIAQRTSRGGHKSTMATLTELHPYLRLLFTRLGVQHCPACGVPVEARPAAQISALIREHHAQRRITLLAPLVRQRKGLYAELARHWRKQGHERLRVDGEWLPTRPWPRLDRYRLHDIELGVATLLPDDVSGVALDEALAEALAIGQGQVRVLEDEHGACTSFSTRRACPDCGISFPEPDPRRFSHHSPLGWCTHCEGSGLDGQDDDRTEAAAACPHCEGSRLNPDSRAVRLNGLTLPDLLARPVDALADWFAALSLSGREAEIGAVVVDEIRARLQFLQRIGLGYLALSRSAPTLSGGEAQRIRLAAQLGGPLRGVCYVLDEPTIGLHPRDNRVLIDTLLALRDAGNTVVVVEHDEETMLAADHLVELGPGAGRHGGALVASGSPAALMANPHSLSGRMLAAPALAVSRGRAADAFMHLRNGCRHNLRSLDLCVPMGCLVAVTGVSGSGKSTLVHEVLAPNLRALADGHAGVQHCHGFQTDRPVTRVVDVDQSPIGKTSRSCPATYVGFWDAIRRLFADTFDARAHGWNAARFSFNTGQGRCPVCEGQGEVRVEMNFLPDVKTPCDACQGRRFNRETLDVRWNGHDIAQVLALPVDDALVHFAAHPSIARPLALMQAVGLGYLQLGQASATLSGGEAQRLRLVSELARPGRTRRGTQAQADHAVYLLDEPTVGLHRADIARLIDCLQRLVDQGHSVLVVEHDLDLVAVADWVIDLGPEGGAAGGQLVAAGPPSELARHAGSHTGRCLSAFLSRHPVAGEPASD